MMNKKNILRMISLNNMLKLLIKTLRIYLHNRDQNSILPRSHPSSYNILGALTVQMLNRF